MARLIGRSDGLWTNQVFVRDADAVAPPLPHAHPFCKAADVSIDSSGAIREAVFVTTHWSLVLSAQEKDSPGSFEALEALCRAYWYPLYAFARRQGQRPHNAQDLTQEFFARLLKKDYLKSAVREKGRFRTFLLTAFKRFLADEWDRQHAQKRGGFATIVSIDQELAESRFAAEPAHRLQPDVLFDRQWAVTLLERVMARLQEEYLNSGRVRLFEHLRHCLADDESGLSYAQIAAEMNLTEAAVKMAVHRLRVRYREIIHGEIAQTVSSPSEVQEEIRHLFSTFES
jgi:RNA polymerase sigma-70 factor (ECF subfamily)